MKIGLFEHGGMTRTILSIEIGRAALRDTKATCAEEAIELVTAWLKFNKVPWTRADGMKAAALPQRPKADDDKVIASVKCPTCGRAPGERCMTVRAQGSIGFQFQTPTHQRRRKAFA